VFLTDTVLWWCQSSPMWARVDAYTQSLWARSTHKECSRQVCSLLECTVVWIRCSPQIFTILLTWRRGHQTSPCGHVLCRHALVLSHRECCEPVDCLNQEGTHFYRPVTAYMLAALFETSLTIHMACEKC
jgi:hypothetical protein